MELNTFDKSTNSTDQDPSWEAKSFSAIKEIPRIL
jgi:hypothetical protein